MTRIGSSMVGAEFAATMFLVDLQGHPEDRPLELAMKELAFLTSEVEILGDYAAQDYRTHRNLAARWTDQRTAISGCDLTATSS